VNQPEPAIQAEKVPRFGFSDQKQHLGTGAISFAQPSRQNHLSRKYLFLFRL
jgi:hypothetical protein